MIVFDPGSFKDPAGRVFYHDDRVFRTLGPKSKAEFEAFVASGLYARLAEKGRIVRTELRASEEMGLPVDEVGAFVLEHERIPFVTYPYEWSFDMLRDAALLALDLLAESLEAGYSLKDATPFNVQFVAGKPVWIDILSFEPYREGQPWVGYSQFCSTCLYPLLLASHLGLEFQSLLRGTLTGVSATDAAKLFRWTDVRRRGVLLHVFVAARLQRSFGQSQKEVSREVKRAGVSRASLLNLARGLKRLVAGLAYREADSVWADYVDRQSYDSTDLQRKKDFVQGAVRQQRPQHLWDLGCNTGEYSDLAAETAELVVSFDIDPAAINRLYLSQKAGKRSPKLQPIVGDLTNPSPNLGWALAERRSWLERGKPDFFLGLALVHHLAIGGNIPLAEVVAFLRRVAPAGVVEFVSKDDDLVRQMLANREDVFDDYGKASFEAMLARDFAIERQFDLKGGTRTIYALGPKA
ncbi:MAG: class I SAM-dependent methyltransferase [Kiloniellales bacterium]